MSEPDRPSRLEWRFFVAALVVIDILLAVVLTALLHQVWSWFPVVIVVVLVLLGVDGLMVYLARSSPRQNLTDLDLPVPRGMLYAPFTRDLWDLAARQGQRRVDQSRNKSDGDDGEHS